MFVFLVYRLSFISHLAPLNSFFKKASIFENTVISLPTYFLPLTKLLWLQERKDRHGPEIIIYQRHQAEYRRKTPADENQARECLSARMKGSEAEEEDPRTCRSFL